MAFSEYVALLIVTIAYVNAQYYSGYRYGDWDSPDYLNYRPGLSRFTSGYESLYGRHDYGIYDDDYSDYSIGFRPRFARRGIYGSLYPRYGGSLYGGSLYGGSLYGGSLYGGSLYEGSLYGGSLFGGSRFGSRYTVGSRYGRGLRLGRRSRYPSVFGSRLHGLGSVFRGRRSGLYSPYLY